MFIIAIVIVGIIYLQVNRRLKVINQAIKASSPTKTGTLTRKPDINFQISSELQPHDWKESDYDLIAISESKNNYSDKVKEKKIPAVYETIIDESFLQATNIPTYENTTDQEI